MSLSHDMASKRILVIEDEEHIAEGLRLNLSMAGYEVKTSATGILGLEAWKQWRPDLIVLDIMLPGIDGFSVLRSIRLEDERLPVLILSARGDADDKIRGLTYGVDDYMAKPFNLQEFLLRVKRLLERAFPPAQNTVPGAALPGQEKSVCFGCNQVDLEARIARTAQGEIRLSEQEVKLLKLFFQNKGRPLSRKEILEVGWGYSGSTDTRTVDNFLVRFRKYFEADPKKPRHFKSMRSLGYVFEE